MWRCSSSTRVHLRARLARTHEMRIRVRDSDIYPTLSKMATVQFTRKIGLDQNPAVPVFETGVAHIARIVAAKLVDLQAERVGQERERSLNIAVCQRRVDVHSGRGSVPRMRTIRARTR